MRLLTAIGMFSSLQRWLLAVSGFAAQSAPQPKKDQPSDSIARLEWFNAPTSTRVFICPLTLTARVLAPPS